MKEESAVGKEERGEVCRAAGVCVMEGRGEFLCSFFVSYFNG